MNTRQWMERATTVAETIYNHLLEQVVEPYVLKDKCDRQYEDERNLPESRRCRELSENEKKAVKAGNPDPRVTRLMSISGKGGWDENPDKQKRYSKNYNVTLLEHLLSVTRGSLMLASLDWLSRNPDMDEDLLKRKLYVMAVVAFMHDIDKDLYLPRIKNVDDISDDQVKERMERYGINPFFAFAKDKDNVNVHLEPDQLLYLIDKVESQQANRRLPKELPPRYTDGTLPLYVRLADKLDGIWLDNDPQKESEKKGITGVLARLQKDRSCIKSEFLRDLLSNGRLIDIFDPHHSFLLDEFQQQLSLCSRYLVGAPPLLEIHQDGHLVVLLYQEKSQEVINQAIHYLSGSLPFSLKLNVPPRGEPALLNVKPSHDELKEFIHHSNDLPHSELKKLFLIKAADKDTLKDKLYDLLEDIELLPNFPSKFGQLVTLYDSDKDISIRAKKWLKQAAHAILLLNLNLPVKPKDKIPKYDEREAAFINGLSEECPKWISDIEHGHSRRVVTALWAVTLAEQDKDKKIYTAIWGEGGLLQQWLEGTEKQPGFREFIKAEGDTIIKGVKSYFEQLVAQQYIEVENEQATGRCLITDQPVDAKVIIKDDLGLGKVGIKVSAFSGRDNRPESLELSTGYTNLSPVSIAEYKLRAKVHEAHQGKKEIPTPTLISSPTTQGLFGSLALDGEKSMNVLSLRELSKFTADGLRGMEHYKGRYRILRFEHLSGKTAEQVNQLYWLLKAALRVGRSIHIFRGLPTANPAFFYYDAIPTLLSNLLGGRELRLEEIPKAIKDLELAQSILKTPGLGYDVLRLYAAKQTRFAAICLIWCDLLEQQKVRHDTKDRLLHEYLLYRKGVNTMTDTDRAVVDFAEAAATIQSNRGTAASISKQWLVLKICMDFITEERKAKVPQMDDDSLILGIAGLLEENLARKGMVAASKHRQGKTLRASCMEVAKIFVKRVWQGVLAERAPNQGRFRNLKSIYRMAFIQCYQKSNDSEETEDTEELVQSALFLS